MTHTTHTIPDAWKNGKRATAAAFSTDGNVICSYQLVIGIKDKGKLIVFNFSGRGGKSISVTTSKHVGLAMKVADEVISPDSPEYHKLIKKYRPEWSDVDSLSKTYNFKHKK